MQRFAGRVAIVTGAGSGIGLAIAEAFAAEGAAVAIADINPEAGASAAAAIVAAGGRAIAVTTDVADEPQVARMVDETVARAREAGGRVVIEPRDARGTRVALVIDPTGAPFAVAEWNRK